MHRTTRSLSLTPEGEAFLPYAQALVEGEAAGRAILRSSAAGASGLLRVTTPVAFARKIIAPMVPRLLQLNPDLRIDLDMTDRVVDLVSSGVDLAIRISRLRDSGLIARRLAGSPRILCASPAYLRARGAPSSLEDLSLHDCLVSTGVTHWVFLAGGQERRVRVGGRFSASSVDGLLEACLNGGGIGLLAEWNIRDELRRGTLVALPIEGGTPEEWAIWAVYPSARLVLPKLRVFVAALEAELSAR